MVNIYKEIHQHNLKITIERKSANDDVYYDYIEIIISKPEPNTMLKKMIKRAISFYQYSNDMLMEELQDIIRELLKEGD